MSYLGNSVAKEAKFMRMLEEWAVGCVDNVVYDDYRWDKVVPNTLDDFCESVWFEIAHDDEIDVRFVSKEKAMPLIRDEVARRVAALRGKGYRFSNIPEVR